MTRDVQRNDRNGPEREFIAVAEQAVELRSVAREFGAFVENLAEHVLDDGDGRANGEFPAELFLEVGAGGQMVSMGVRFEHPVDGQAAAFDVGDDLIRGCKAGAARRFVEIPHAVDDRGALARGIVDDMADGERVLVEEAAHHRPRVLPSGHRVDEVDGAL